MNIDIQYTFDAANNPERPFKASTVIRSITISVNSNDGFDEAKLDLIHKVKDLVQRYPAQIPDAETVNTDDYNGEEE